MSFVQRELFRISAELSKWQEGSDEYRSLYAAQQSLAWALEPNGFKAPYAMIMGTREGIVDYPVLSSPCPS